MDFGLMGFKVGDTVSFQFGSDYLTGKIVNFLSPIRAEIEVPADDNRIYEVDVFYLA